VCWGGLTCGGDARTGKNRALTALGSTALSRTHALARNTLERCMSTYGDEKVANREIRVWHFVIENGP
jgi:hypothetical protein